MKFHPVASIFPMMSAEEFSTLKADIQANGLREPIWTHDDQIIDGRNRYNACEAVGVEPQFRQWVGTNEEEMVWFVVSLNEKRRHLTSSQKAIVALNIEEYLAKMATQRKGGRPVESYTASKGLNGIKPVEKIPPVKNDKSNSSNKSRDKAAKATGTNPRYVNE